AGYTIEGDMDTRKFRQVMEQLVMRHEAFRTSFHMIDGEVYQKVREVNPDILTIESIDEEHIHDKMVDFIQPFVLSQAPLIRVKLMSYGPEKHVLAIDMHHIISDQSSIAILMDEIKTLYNDEALTTLTIQYKDFADWQNRYFETDDYSRKMTYWKNEFQDGVPMLDILTDYKRPDEALPAGDMMTFD